MVTVIVGHGSVLSGKLRSEVKEAITAEIIPTLYFSKQDLYQEYSLNNMVRGFELLAPCLWLFVVAFYGLQLRARCLPLRVIFLPALAGVATSLLHGENLGYGGYSPFVGFSPDSIVSGIWPVLEQSIHLKTPEDKLKVQIAIYVLCLSFARGAVIKPVSIAMRKALVAD